MRFAAPMILAAALTALTLGCSPSDEPAEPTTTTVAPRRPAPTTTVTTTATGTTTAGTSAAAQTITVTVAGGSVTPQPGPVAVRLGSPVVIEVSADAADEVHLYGYDQVAQVRPGQPARLALVADRPGQFEVELESAGLLLLVLSVS